MVGEDVPGWIGGEIDTFLRFLCNPGIGNIRCLDPTFVDGAAEDIAGKEFEKFPDAVLFDIDIFPDGHTDERPLFDRPRHGAEEEAVPAALRGFAVRFDIDNAGNRHQDVQIIRGRFLRAVSGVVIGRSRCR